MQMQKCLIAYWKVSCFAESDATYLSVIFFLQQQIGKNILLRGSQ